MSFSTVTTSLLPGKHRQQWQLLTPAEGKTSGDRESMLQVAGDSPACQRRIGVVLWSFQAPTIAWHYRWRVCAVFSPFFLHERSPEGFSMSRWSG
jgi:hypothetical protein